MQKKLFKLFFFISLLIGWQSNGLAAFHAFIPSSSNYGDIEVFYSKPDEPGPHPALLLIHPEQESPKIGGEMFVKNGQLDFWAHNGYVGISISQPGYGQSKTKSDFCGPNTQQAVIDVINYFRAQDFVSANRFFVYGGSRGAVVASMISTHDLGLRGVILKSGVYDFISWSNSRSWFNPIKLTMMWEIGFLTDEKLKDRSAFYRADKIKVPLLIIHGSNNDRAPFEGAEAFRNKIVSSGGRAEIIKIESGHIIPMNEITEIMEKFMAVLNKKYHKF